MYALEKLLLLLARDCRGATAIEYTLLAALIGAAAIFGFDQVGQELAVVFERTNSALQQPTP